MTVQIHCTQPNYLHQHKHHHQHDHVVLLSFSVFQCSLNFQYILKIRQGFLVLPTWPEHACSWNILMTSTSISHIFTIFQTNSIETEIYDILTSYNSSSLPVYGNWSSKEIYARLPTETAHILLDDTNKQRSPHSSFVSTILDATPSVLPKTARHKRDFLKLILTSEFAHWAGREIWFVNCESTPARYSLIISGT